MMFVLRKTMDEAIAAERSSAWERICELTRRYGNALERVTALQTQLSSWILNEPRNITPEQMAQMFYAQDDRWQAAFFNCMQDQVRAFHDAQPPARPGTIQFGPGFPAGEGQWWHMAQHLDDAGFETVEAMFEHAKTKRETIDQEAA